MADTPNLGEIATADHGMLMARAYSEMLIENPDSVLQTRGRDYKIYEELLRDDQVKSTYQQRRTGLTSKSWFIEPASDSDQDVAIADFITENLENVNLDDKFDKMHYGIFYGHAVAECMWKRDGARILLGDILVRDRKRFKYNAKGELCLINIDHPAGLVMPERKFWTFNAGASHDDNPYGLGLAHSLYWPVFFKRNDIKFWLIFLEKFGMPTTAIKLPPGQIDNAQEIAKARKVIASIQADSGVIIPENMVVELLEAARSGTADYDGLVERMDKAISKVVLSQTMTTDDGSSMAQAKVHRGVSREVVDSDADLMNDSFRRQVMTWLVEWNFPGAKVPKLKRNTEPEEDLNERADRDTKIHALGFDPTEEYIEETYGAGWVKREAQPVPGPLLSDGSGDMPAEFAELSGLLGKRVDHRADMRIIADAAASLAMKYQGMYGDRIAQIVSFLEESQDIEAFRRDFYELLGSPPPTEAVDTIHKANWFARLMGIGRGQRD